MASDPTPPPTTVVNFGDMEQTTGQTGADSVVRTTPPTYREQVVVRLTTWVGGAIVVLTLVLILEWVWHAPALPTSLELKGPASTLADNADNARKLVDNYKALSDVAADRSIKIFDSFIGKAFLPVFTTLIGYIIGTRSGRDG